MKAGMANRITMYISDASPSASLRKQIERFSKNLIIVDYRVNRQ